MERMKTMWSEHAKLCITIIALIVVIVLFYLVSTLSSSGRSLAPNLNFQYEELPTTYITATDWPPRIEIVQKPFSCTDSGSEITPQGQTVLRKIDGRPFCITSSSQGAAGSTYTDYTYAFAKNNVTVIFSFTLRAPQCENYDTEKKTACESERSSFDLDSIVEKMAKSV